MPLAFSESKNRLKVFDSVVEAIFISHSLKL
jgi:hypothetical protein